MTRSAKCPLCAARGPSPDVGKFEVTEETVFGRGLFIQCWPLTLQLRGFKAWGFKLCRKRYDEYGSVELTEDKGRFHALVVHLGTMHIRLGGYPGNGGYTVFRIVREPDRGELP